MNTGSHQQTEYPFDTVFYSNLIARRARFKLLSTATVPPNTGYGFRVEAGHAFRFTLLDGPQTLDTCLLSADDPTEHCAPGPQMAIEGAIITRLTRLWSTPPRSRPLVTCIANTVDHQPNALHMRDHFHHTAYCNYHVRYLFERHSTRIPCYDNLRKGMAMIGLSPRDIPDNMNLFMKAAIDPVTGAVLVGRSEGRPGDYIEFYAEVPVFCVFSLCPAGGGSEHALREGEYEDPPIFPISVETFTTNVSPLEWAT